MKRFVFSSGDINGIGPEIVFKAINEMSDSKIQFIVTGPGNILSSIIADYNLNYKRINSNNISDIRDSKTKVTIVDIGEYNQKIGFPTKDSGEAAYRSIISAIEIIKENIADVLITAPISKEAFKFAGIKFPGHTELIASETSSSDFAMMFLSDNFKCMLATIHIPLSKVADEINIDLIKNKILLTDKTLKIDFGISKPKIAILGLNPHAGENGNIGNEELEIIKPAIKETNLDNVEGPFVPDAFFGLKQYTDFDCVLAMYHDQALIPFKLLNFDVGVNYTAGLSVIRTSPDHGTAFNIAGKNVANHKSMIEAVKWAEIISKNRKKFDR